MKILVDLTYILPNIVTGVANYAFRLLDGFVKCNYQDIFILLLTSANKDLITNRLPQYKGIVFDSKPLPYLRGILNKQRLNRIIRKEKVDIFFLPYINHSGLYQTLIPCVGVLHDAQGFELMKTPFKQLLYDVFTKHMLKQVTHLVTISEYSKLDIERKLPCLKSSITVIYNSIDVRYMKIQYGKLNKLPYILNVNTLEPYKNLMTLIKAFNLVKDIIPHRLIVKASMHPYWHEEIEPYLKQHQIEDRVILISEKYTEIQMAELYKNADLFVTPSLKEGFGYTPIEAALYEVPVVCSKESALYETTCGLLNYYEPATDPVSLKNAILRVLNNPPANLKETAHEFAERYSEDKQACNFMRLFKESVN